MKQQNASNVSKEPFAKKAGNKIERLGDKISNAGADKIGEVVHKAGDKLEHSQDDKKRSTH